MTRPTLATDASPLQANLHFNLALKQFQSQKLDDAKASLSKALAASPKHPQANLLQGIVACQQGRWQDAVEPLKIATQKLPDNSDAFNNLGVAYFQLERYGEAENAFRKVLALKPDRTDAWMNLGVLGLKQKKPALAKEAFLKATQQDPKASRGWLGLAEAHTALEDRAAAAAAQTQALALVPEDPPLRLALAENLYRLGQLDKAAEVLSALKGGREAQAEFLAGVLAYRRGDFDASRADFEAALVLKPDYPEARFNLAITLYDQGHYDEALAQFNEVLAIHPHDTEARKNLDLTRQAAVKAFLREGSQEFVKSDYLAALEKWRKALAFDESNKVVKDLVDTAQAQLKVQADDLSAGADAAWAAGKREDAIQGWTQALSRDPSSDAAQKGLAKAKSEVQKLLGVYERQVASDLVDARYRRAWEGAAKAMALDPTVGERLRAKVEHEVQSALALASTAAAAARKKGALAEELEALGRAVSLAPDDKGLQLRQNQAKVALRLALDKALVDGKAAEASGKTTAALKSFQRALELQSSNGQAREAVKRLGGAAKAKGAQAIDVEDLYYQGVYAYAAGDTDKATALWKQVLTADPKHGLAKEALERALRRSQALKKT